MKYTIKQVSEKIKLSEHTLRYYDREGLMPLLKRSSTGIRLYTENDVNWLELICCLKNSGMSLSEIKEFMNLCLQGEKTCEERKDILEHHKKDILNQIEYLKQSLNTINYKIDHYKEIGIFHIDSPLGSK
ncbi:MULTISPECIES: MerR family transcriptional regulator [Clostridium]|jgi:DNA-binding transcriptional MerR regulator|uniref:MerR family transcriptional regulator n=2 Tax=root TaxID=1 RepID=R9C7U8_9CLOT|nr:MULTISPECIES: MerR family transcriptional regulator [Clostridium]EOR25085.1 MerR family transcriptional regulator [Clostridium sartagoforme AAU1]KLE15268.1 MerR family transcriptional regulator [Clostridium sp. C8]